MELISSNKSAGSTSANSRPTCPIESDRLWDSIMAMAEFGGLPGGGCARLSLSDEDRAARDQFVRWCRDARCEDRVDSFGNIFAVRLGRDPTLPVIL